MALDYPSLPGRRRTKIVATIGPSSQSPARLRELLTAGVDVIRLNFSHGTYAEHLSIINESRRIAAELRRPLAILQDLQGPRLRVGNFADPQGVTLVPGKRFTLTTEEVLGSSERVSITYKSLPREVSKGSVILLDDGRIRLRVARTDRTTITCEVVEGGTLTAHKGMNLPGVKLSAPSTTEKDVQDLAFGLKHGVDLVALSFVREPKDANTVRALMDRAKRRVPVIAKIERAEAIEALDDILTAFDGVMVARGDLGVELGAERVPILQKSIIARATALMKPVITATQMLESMVSNPTPTRAEASDVANAILDGTDAVMLSAETSIGKYPIEAVGYMDRIAVEADKVGSQIRPPSFGPADPARAVVRTAHALAQEVEATAFVLLTTSGLTAQYMAKFHPNLPAYAYSGEQSTYRKLALSWGITPVETPFTVRTNEMIDYVEVSLVKAGLVKPGQRLIIVGSAPFASRGATNFLKVHTVGAKRKR